jgi:glucose dehydrogenase
MSVASLSELWSSHLQTQVNANPMVYRAKSGRQFVAAVATDSLVAFALP